MSALKTLAGKLSFAHLAGLSAKGAKSRADEDPENDRDESADDDDKDYKDDQDRSNGDSKKGKRAEGDDKDNADDDSDSDERADADDLDDDKKDGKKSKRAKADTDNDDDDERAEDDDDEDEMHGKSAAASARRRERARCATIMGSKYATRNIVLAANLAFNTTMTRTQALAVLRDTPAASPANAGRSGRNPNLGAGGEHAPSSSQAIESRWERTMKKVTGR